MSGWSGKIGSSSGGGRLEKDQTEDWRWSAKTEAFCERAAGIPSGVLTDWALGIYLARIRRSVRHWSAAEVERLSSCSLAINQRFLSFRAERLILSRADLSSVCGSVWISWVSCKVYSDRYGLRIIWLPGPEWQWKQVEERVKKKGGMKRIDRWQCAGRLRCQR